MRAELRFNESSAVDNNNKTTQRDLWMFLTGGLFAAGKVTREQLLGSFDPGDAPADIARVLAALLEGERGPIMDWFQDHGAVLAEGRTVFQAVGETVTQQATERRVAQIKDELVGARVMPGADLVDFLKRKASELENTLNHKETLNGKASEDGASSSAS